jgi:hypothetical protein
MDLGTAFKTLFIFKWMLEQVAQKIFCIEKKLKKQKKWNET